MAIVTSVVGSYPKPPKEGHEFTLRKTLHAIERSQAGEAELSEALDALVRAVVAEQEAAGLDVVTDGQVRWDDIVTPFARNMAGFEVDGLLRFFDNNVYYRRPVCTGNLEWRGPSSVNAWRFASSIANTPVKAVVPGPATFAHLAVDEHYNDLERFVMAIAQVLAQEVFELEAAGARHIQIDEPALLEIPQHLALAGRALEVVTADIDSAEVTLATYFSDAKRLGADLFTLPATVFALDFVAGPANFELVAQIPGDKKLQAGLVDARNTKLEDEDELARSIAEFAAALGPERLVVAPSCGLEFLPRERAHAKLELLVAATGKVDG